jgi:ABC-type dipeptide/oligopeptide/nickel transport system ATPase component
VSLLEVKDLHVSFPTADGVVRAVRGVSFDVEPGRTLGIVGESGSGKTVLTQTLLGLTPGAEVEGSALFEGTDLIGLSEDRLRHVRGARISVIFQDPLTSLHPLYRIGWQISEMIRAHEKSVSKKEAAARTVELLRRVGIPKPETRVNDYPHQFSGGMRQRAMIAMALALEPKLADPRPAAPAAAGLGHRADHDHARPRGRRRHRRRRHGHVRRPRGGEGVQARRLLRTASPVYQGPA